MAKVLLIGDTHNGANGNNPRLLQQNVDLYQKFIPNIILQHNIDFCIDLGDFFDDREKIDVKTLGIVRNKMLKDLPVPFYFIVGNHNLYYKNSTLVNNLTETIGDIPNVIVVDNFKEVEGIDLVPWVTASNAEYFTELIKTSTNRWCCGHFEFNGFQFDKSRVADVKEKIPANLFSKYDKVFSGHYHVASEKGNVIYVGSPIQLTWIDVDVEKRVIVLDTESGIYYDVVNDDNLYVQYKLDHPGGFPTVGKEEIEGKRVKVHYNVDVPKEEINNLQAILKTWGPDQLNFIPYGQKKKTETTVTITNGLEESIKEYLQLMPMDNEKYRSTVEKIVLSYYNKSENKE